MFLDRDKCLDYLTRMVFFRAKNLGVRVLDLDKPLQLVRGRASYPVIRRKCDVREKLDRDGDFALALSFDELMEPEDMVTVGLRKVEVR